MEDLIKIFKALSDETRLKILKLLEKGELCVCEIISALNMVQPKVSFHLGILRDAGLVKTRKKGKWILYSLDDSDLFKRFLLLSVLERIPPQQINSRSNKNIPLLNIKEIAEMEEE